MSEIEARLARIPRQRLALLPTPLQAFPRLAADLGVSQFWVKRDDLTGIAFGGNKVRNLEFRLAEALSVGADTVIAGLEAQSNSARQVTASANMLGLKTILVLNEDRDWQWQGNLLVDKLLGADVRFRRWSSQEELSNLLIEVRDEAINSGARPFVMNLAPSFAQGSALAYLLCLLELETQMHETSITPTNIYMASGNKGYAGLALGKRLLNRTYRVIGISQRRGTDHVSGAIAGVRDAAAALGWDVDLSENEIEISTDYVGEGYGIPTTDGLAAMKWAAQREGLLLDPIYTGKAMAGIVHHARTGRLNRDSTVIFIHTGGLPAMFAYKDDILASL